MKRNNAAAFERAKKFVFLLLKFRQRPERELIFRLKEKDFDEETINKTIVYLRKYGFIGNKKSGDHPEEKAASEIVRQKLKELKGIAPQAAKRRIYTYLLRRGFSPETVNEVIFHKTPAG